MATTESTSGGTVSTSDSVACVAPTSGTGPILGRVRPEAQGTVHTVTLFRDPASARTARRYAVACCPEHPRPDDIALATGELVANAIDHGEGDAYTLTVAAVADGVVVTVANRTLGRLVPLEPTTDPLAAWEESGRGLRAVSGVAELTIRVSAFLPHAWDESE